MVVRPLWFPICHVAAWLLFVLTMLFSEFADAVDVPDFDDVE